MPEVQTVQRNKYFQQFIIKFSSLACTVYWINKTRSFSFLPRWSDRTRDNIVHCNTEVFIFGNYYSHEIYCGEVSEPRKQERSRSSHYRPEVPVMKARSYLGGGSRLAGPAARRFSALLHTHETLRKSPCWCYRYLRSFVSYFTNTHDLFHPLLSIEHTSLISEIYFEKKLTLATVTYWGILYIC